MSAKSTVSTALLAGAVLTALSSFSAYAAGPLTAGEMAAATDAFGRGGRDMALAMREGAAGIDAMMDSAQAGGGSSPRGWGTGSFAMWQVLP